MPKMQASKAAQSEPSQFVRRKVSEKLPDLLESICNNCGATLLSRGDVDADSKELHHAKICRDRTERLIQ
jgi:hypothetical protein